MAQKMTVKQVAAHVTRPDGTPITPTVIWHWIYKGVMGRKLPIERFGKFVYVDQDELNSFLDYMRSL